MKKIFKLLPLLVLSIALVGCNEKKEETRNYSDYSDYQSTFEEFYNHDGRYALYIYQEACSHCSDIKGTIFDYVDEMKAGKKTYFDGFYLLELHSIKTEQGVKERAYFKDRSDYTDKDNDKLVELMLESKPTTLSETYFTYTPSMYIVNNHTFENDINGSTKIPNFLSAH